MSVLKHEVSKVNYLGFQGVAPNTWRTPHGESSRIWANVARRVRSSYSTRNTPIGEGSIGSALRKVDVAG